VLGRIVTTSPILEPLPSGDERLSQSKVADVVSERRLYLMVIFSILAEVDIVPDR
jgi:hypothetical protein